MKNRLEPNEQKWEVDCRICLQEYEDSWDEYDACPKSEDCYGARSTVEKELRALGWRKSRVHGWVCPEHAKWSDKNITEYLEDK